MKKQIIASNPNQLNDRFVAKKQLTYLNSNKFIVFTIDIFALLRCTALVLCTLLGAYVLCIQNENRFCVDKYGYKNYISHFQVYSARRIKTTPSNSWRFHTNCAENLLINKFKFRSKLNNKIVHTIFSRLIFVSDLVF